MEKESQNCIVCLEEKSFDCFSRHPKGKNGLFATCKYCSNQKRKERRALNPEKEYSQWRERYHLNIDKFRKEAREKHF